MQPRYTGTFGTEMVARHKKHCRSIKPKVSKSLFGESRILNNCSNSTNYMLNNGFILHKRRKRSLNSEVAASERPT